MTEVLTNIKPIEDFMLPNMQFEEKETDQTRLVILQPQHWSPDWCERKSNVKNSSLIRPEVFTTTDMNTTGSVSST